MILYKWKKLNNYLSFIKNFYIIFKGRISLKSRKVLNLMKESI